MGQLFAISAPPKRAKRRLSRDDARAVAQALADGWTIGRIADQFSLSPHYVAKLSNGSKRPAIRRLADTLVSASVDAVIRRAQRDAVAAYLQIRALALGSMKAPPKVQLRACIDLLNLALAWTARGQSAREPSGEVIDLAAFADGLAPTEESIRTPPPSERKRS